MTHEELSVPTNVRLAVLERAEEARQAEMLQEKPLFLLSRLVVDSTSLPDLSKSFQDMKDPTYEWWIGFAILYSAGMIEVLGNEVLATVKGRDFYKEFESSLDRFNSESPNITSSQA